MIPEDDFQRSSCYMVLQPRQMHFVVGYHHIIPAEGCLNGCRPRKDLAQRVKPMLPSMNLDCRAVLVVVGQTGRNKIAPAHHLVILDESVSMILKFLPDF